VYGGRRQRRYARDAAVGLALLIGLVVGALAARSGRADTVRAGSSPVIVRYVGPHGALARDARLRATATSPGARIVAVTFLLDGRPLGSVTSPPYSLALNTGIVVPGRHLIRAVAVDSLGRSATSGSVSVRTRADARRVVTLSPESGLQHVLRSLRENGATVRLRPGRYEVQNLVLGSGATLVGSGRGTVLAAPSGAGSAPVLSLQGREIQVADLAIDAGGQSGDEPIAIAVPDGSADVSLRRISLVNVHGDGINVWGAHSNVSVQDSSIDGGGTGHAGVFALESPASRDTSVIRTRITGFRSFGILFAQQAYGLADAGLHALALDNRVSGISDPDRAICTSQPLQPGCGTNEIGIETGAVGAAVVRNRIADVAWDGIETVGSSTRTTVARNAITRTRTGIYLEHATNRSRITRNSISSVETGINVEWRYDGIGSTRNTFDSNRIVDATKHGLFIGVGEDGNSITRNVFVRGGRPAIVLQGSSGNRVTRNVGCGASAPLVAEESAPSDTGQMARPDGNLAAGNVDVPSCRGS
jgi:hypothetical protein